jgi:hypothetical protein
MARSASERANDVKKVLAGARAVLERRAAIAPAIVESTALSPEGVELAFTKSLETHATDAELATLVARAGDASRVTVILSANVFVAALRAIALARAASERVVVRPSKRDPTFARALVEAIGDPAVALDEAFEVASQTEGEIHVYGRDDTIADVKRRAKVRVRGHGSGMGIAWISPRAELAAAARLLAEDVVLFDQRGCLSPRVALVAGGPDVSGDDSEARASALADALHAELERLGSVVPRGALPADERGAGARYVATMTYACRALVGDQHAIGVAPPGAPLVLPPPYRHVHVAPCASPAAAKALLEPLAKAVVAAGSDALEEARALAPPWARFSALGRMQRPPLDGPVDLRET